ncbi:MAG: Zn-dependent hydrolase, glyoxylase [Herbinix sp.]|nr:Zn-dependent hydrolase, glyoxylase [Herbinix sp.]
MIDTGLPDTFSNLLQLLNQQSIQINEINYLLITHFHPDHAGLTQNLCDLGITLVIHEEQYPYMSKLNLFYKKNWKANYKDIIPSQALILTDDSSSRFFEEIGIHGELIKEAYNDFVIEDSWDMLLQYQPKIIYPSHADPYKIEAIQ